MKLWTIINQSQYDYIKKYGYLRTDGRRVWPEFKKAYDWLAGVMKQQIGNPPFNIKYPIWAWQQWEGIDRKKPDIRCLRHMCGNGTFYRIELDITEERIVLSNFMDWHCVLNRSYLPFTEKEDNNFDRQFNDQNLKYGDWDNYPKYIRQTIETSWHRIFDFKSIREYAYVGEIKDREIQATFWILYKDDIKKIDKFESKLSNEWR